MSNDKKREIRIYRKFYNSIIKENFDVKFALLKKGESRKFNEDDVTVLLPYLVYD